ncbi:unnamed protein product, partial [Trichobilharzia regenti]
PIATRQSNFDTLELHEKLAALHLHQQVKEHLVSSDSGASKHAVHSSSVTPKVDSSQASSTKHEQNGVEVVRQNPAAVVNEVTACAEHINQVQLHHCADQTQDSKCVPFEGSLLNNNLQII